MQLPRLAATRIVGVDIARGVAVLGMYGAHVAVTRSFNWAEPDTWLDLVHGRSSILFALLAGVSIAIISGGRSPATGTSLLQARTRILVRAVLIFTIGGILEYLGTGIAIILPTYAALFVLALPFLRWSPRALLVAAGSIGIVMPFLLAIATPFLPPVDLYFGGGAVVEYLAAGFYPGLLWIAFVLAGLAIGRLDLGNLGIQLRLVAVGVALAAIAYTAGGLGAEALNPGGTNAPPLVGEGGFEVVPGEEVDLTGQTCDTFEGTSFCYPPGYYDDAEIEKGPAVGQEDPEPTPGTPVTIDLGELVTIEPHSGSPFEVIGSGGFAAAVLGLCLLAARVKLLRVVLFPVASVGAMALTAYTVQVVAIAALGETAWAYADNWLFLGFVVAALAACSLWIAFLGRGPLERLLTWVSHRAARTDSENPAAATSG